MIKFFRSIRQKLLQENRTTKYLVYAVGEIILVVIGILIALQINSWYGNKLNTAKQTHYLENIVRDLHHQVGGLDFHIKEENDNQEDIFTLLSHYKKNLKFELNDTLLNCFGSVFDRTTYLANRTTYSQLISTGDIGLIKNNQLRDDIVLYYQDAKRRELVILKNNDVKDNVINSIFLKSVGLTFESTIKELEFMEMNFPYQLEETNKKLEDEATLFEVLNIIKLRLLATYATVSWFEEDKQKTMDLIESINKELNIK